MGTWRTLALLTGPAPASRASWWRTSGDALIRNHRTPSGLTAIDDCDRGCTRPGSARAVRQVGHQQFHWGTAPPAAVPRRMICRARGATGGRGGDGPYAGLYIRAPDAKRARGCGPFVQLLAAGDVCRDFHR